MAYADILDVYNMYRKQIARMIEPSIPDSTRMWIDAQRSIQQAKEIQQKIIEQSRDLGCIHRIARSRVTNSYQHQHNCPQMKLVRAIGF